jgi:hypothetical protein
MAVTSCFWGSSKTESSTLITSTRTMCETHAPLATNASARAVCRGSSRATRRTTTLVSTARMSLRHSAPEAHLQVSKRLPRRTLREECCVDLLGGVSARTANDDAFTIFFPLQNGSGRKAELAANLRRDGDLALSSQLGRRKRRHVDALPRQNELDATRCRPPSTGGSRVVLPSPAPNQSAQTKRLPTLPRRSCRCGAATISGVRP